jgi:hypothetical protein
MHWSHLAIPITGILLPLFLVPTAMAMRLRQRKREWEHLERMKSLELGLPATGGSTGGGGVAAIGAGVPIVALMSAFAATVFILESDGPARFLVNGGLIQSQAEALAIVWSCTALVSVVAMVIALVLGVVQARARSQASQSSPWASAHAKPAFDPEAYEFASHRG